MKADFVHLTSILTVGSLGGSPNSDDISDKVETMDNYVRCLE
jgi:hypothetical protein